MHRWIPLSCDLHDQFRAGTAPGGPGRRLKPLVNNKQHVSYVSQLECNTSTVMPVDAASQTAALFSLDICPLVFLVTNPTSCSLLPTEFRNPTIRELLHRNSNPNGHGCLSACHGTLTILVTSVLNLACPASPPNPGNPTTDQRPYLRPRITSDQDPGGHCDLTTDAG